MVRPVRLTARCLQYGAPPSKKQVKEREGLIAGGKPLGAHASKEIRTVGLLKLIRNLAVHGPQMVNAGRFESEETLHHYLIDPFPWLVMACVMNPIPALPFVLC